MRKTIFLNGKFYSAGLNGVHRVADRLIRALDTLVTERPEVSRGFDLRLLLPEERSWTPELRSISLCPQRSGHTQLWEQFVAPFAARDGLLVNLCNLSPIAHRRKLTLIHDAQFFLFPQSYPLHFQVGYRLLTPLMARTSLETLTVSDFSREMLGVFGVSAPGRTRVVYNGGDHIHEVAADPDIVQRLDLRTGRYVLLFGALAGYKNIRIVLKAFENPDLAGLDLVVVGSSAEAFARAGLATPKRCRFAQVVDDAALRALYDSALCLAYPSRTEGFGLPPLEAMGCGAPVVAAPAGAIPEICKDAVIYAGVDDASAWASAFLSLLRDMPLRQAKREAGRTCAAAFTWRRAGVQLLDIIMRHAEGSLRIDGRTAASGASSQ